MFGLSGEHIVILLIILLIFGPRKLPELGNTLGKAIKNFKDSIAGVQDAKYRNLDDQAEVKAVQAAKGAAAAAAAGVEDPTKKS